MTTAYFPYRSAAARDFCFARLDALAAKLWPIPSEGRTVPTSFGDSFVRIGGPPAAPPLVLLPGATATSLMWTPNVQSLSAHCRTFAVDRLGDFGKTLCARPVDTFDDQVLWLDELLDALDLRTGVSLVGISYGGALAAQYALRFPARLDKVVLLAPANSVLRTRAEFWIRVFWLAIARRRGVPAFIRWIFADLARQDPAETRAITDLLFLNMSNMAPRKTPIPRVLTDNEWRGLKPPTLFLVGEHEVIYDAKKAVSRLRQVAPAVTAEIVPNAGHDLTIVQADAVNRRILEFLGAA
jgi:pimeloyl-ACP methyl ester carboxylesterase